MSNALAIARKRIEGAAAAIERRLPWLDATDLDPKSWTFEECCPYPHQQIPEHIFTINAMAEACRELQKAEAEAMALALPPNLCGKADHGT